MPPAHGVGWPVGHGAPESDGIHRPVVPPMPLGTCRHISRSRHEASVRQLSVHAPCVPPGGPTHRFDTQSEPRAHGSPRRPMPVPASGGVPASTTLPPAAPPALAPPAVAPPATPPALEPPAVAPPATPPAVAPPDVPPALAPPAVAPPATPPALAPPEEPPPEPETPPPVALTKPPPSGARPHCPCVHTSESRQSRSVRQSTVQVLLTHRSTSEQSLFNRHVFLSPHATVQSRRQRTHGVVVRIGGALYREASTASRRRRHAVRGLTDRRGTPAPAPSSGLHRSL